jgi:FAD/FMN-containing dehydrogenase
LAARPGATLLLFGHVGDGNVHVNVVGPPADDDEVDDVVLGLVVERGGSISAEHGIGTLKRRWLARDRSPGEVAAMAAIKRALDPDGILNPGVLLP